MYYLYGHVSASDTKYSSAIRLVAKLPIQQTAATLLL